MAANTALRTIRTGRLLLDALHDEILEELHGAWIARLAEPEDRLVAKLLVLVVLRDAHELVERLGIAAALREHEDQLLLDLGVRHLVVQLCERFRRRATVLPGQEQRL